MKSNFSNAIAGGEGSVRGPHAGRCFSGQNGPKIRKGSGQRNNRKRDRALKNALAKEKREMQALAKREARQYERSGSDFGWGEG